MFQSVYLLKEKSVCINRADIKLKPVVRDVNAKFGAGQIGIQAADTAAAQHHGVWGGRLKYELEGEGYSTQMKS